MAGRRPPGPSPKVTGLSPKEGPPGTKLTIRGESLGTSFDDLLSLTVGGIDVLIYAEYISPSKILTRSPRFKGTGDVILTTRSGGVGSCTVQFRGYEEAVSLSKESAVWVNEDELIVSNTTQRHRSSSSPTLKPLDPLKIKYEGNYELDEDNENDEIYDDSFQSTLITSESFDPSLFLVKKHSRATFAQLKEGYKNVSRYKSGRSDSVTLSSSSLSFLKPNVLSVVECLDAMKAVNQALKRDRQEHGTDLTYKIEESLRKAESEAHQIFDSVLSKKELADSTRNALNVLQRYRFLFNLPSIIERNASAGDYDVVINHYSRAKALFEKNEVGIFKRVYGEVENRVRKLEKSLQDKLDQCCTRQTNRKLEELKKLIRHLVQLGVTYDPAWECIVKIKEQLMSELMKCRDKHINLAQLDETSNNPPHVVLFVEESVQLFKLYFPDLIRLGHDYLSGNLCTRENEKISKSKDNSFENEMVPEILRCLITLLRSALLPSAGKGDKIWPQSKNNNMTSWLPSCLRTIIACHQSLSRPELALASTLLIPMHQLIFDFRVYSLSYIFNSVSDEVKNLYMRENWDVISDNSFGSRTQLPILFESKVKETVHLVRENILQTNSPDEVDIFSQINVKGQMKQLTQNLLQSFVISLEKTLTEKIPSTPKAEYSNDERLLIVLCNCIYVVSHLFPLIQETFDKSNYPEMAHVFKVSQSRYKEFENNLLCKFIEEKRDLVIGCIEPSMYSTSTGEWFAPKNRPNDISFYIKEMLMNLITVQGQIFLIAPFLVRKIMIEIIEASIEEITRLHELVCDRFNEFGNLQAKIDFEALKLILCEIESETTDILLESSRKFLQTLRPSDVEQMDKVLNQMRQSLQLQLYCFRWEADQPVIVI